MPNFVYGAISMFLLTAMADVIDSQIPNTLSYYIDLYVPF